MQTGKYKLNGIQIFFVGLIILIILYFAFRWLATVDFHSKYSRQLNDIESRINSGQASATELVDLNLKRNAILTHI